MNWFESALLDACSQEKSDNSQLVNRTLSGTLLFDVSSADLGTHFRCLCFDRFAVVLPDATGSLPGRSANVYLLLHRGCQQLKPVGPIYLFAAVWDPPPEQYKHDMFRLHQERDEYIRVAI